MGIVMKKMVLVAATLAMTAGSAFAADMAVKAPPPPPFEPWDFAFGSALMNDYIFRGITQSAHKPSVAAYFEPRYNINKDVYLYAGLGGARIDFPNRPAAEVDIYAGLRPTFGPVAFDFGGWYYWYPGGQCFNAAVPSCSPSGGVGAVNLPNGNVIKADVSFWEVYGKVNYTVNDNIALGAYVYYSPNVLNTGASGVFYGGTAKYTWAAFSNGVAPYISGEVGHWALGTSDAFYGCTITAGCLANNPGGVNYKDYTTW